MFLDFSLTVNLNLLSLSIAKKDCITNSEIIFEKLLEKANEQGKRVLIAIDEINNTPSLKKFANFYQTMVGKGYSVFLLMTGLRENVDSLTSSDAASFLSRTPKIDLGPLSLIGIAKEYQRLLNLSQKEAVDFAKLTYGYAFAYQVLGYLLFESGAKTIDYRLLSRYDAYLQSNGYDVIWKSLSEKEKTFCFALASSESGQGRQIADSIGMKTHNFQAYRNRLIEKGLLLSPGYGQIEFALPRFKEYVSILRDFL